ncbi:DUF5789 family protein [Halocatena pleomorpha]|uniref:DUF2795 domain-containing protein n=1 Tax=Halocatena pleomorpha TaxID=1785090 RepID=A0A3P3RCY8_9EURY|nr:DUF2795 domain-containing protein [Halocatena pleomorpha]RRJ31291.1 DUF2795 domain-containing protein [Halocatena pleomorpha]
MRLFTDANERFETHSYPATTRELIDEYGDLELALPNGSETIEAALSRVGNETYPDAEAARLAIYGAVSDKAIGRKYYSDRDPSAPGERGHDQLSF